MKSSQSLLCHTKCTLTASTCCCHYESPLDETQCTSEDDPSIEPIKESITHRLCADSTDDQKVTRRTDERAIQRICFSTRRQTHQRHRLLLSRWSLVALLNLLLLVANHRVNGAIASHSPHSPSHRNHSSHVALPSNSSSPPAESLVSSLLSSSVSSSFLSLSSSTLLLEELLQERSLEEAIYKLTNAWNKVHGKLKESNKMKEHQLPLDDLPSEHMISLNQVKLVTLYQLASEEESQPNGTATHSRTRRWTKPQTSNKDNHSKTQLLDSDGLVQSDESRHNQTRRNQHQAASSQAPMQPPPPVTANCTRCRQKDEARSMRIEAIKFNILHKLGLERAPNVSMKSLPEIPPFKGDLLLEQYRLHSEITRNFKVGNSHKKRFAADHFGPLHDHTDQYGDEFYVNAQKSYVFAQSPPPGRIVLSTHRAQYFKFPASIINSHLQQATLWLYLNGSKSNSFNSVGHIHIYKVVRGEPSLVTTLIPNTKVSHSLLQKSDWIQIDIKSLVSDWFDKPEENFGLVIHSHESLHGTELPVIHHDDTSSESSKKPFVEVMVSTRPAESIRRKRTAKQYCDDKGSEVRCCRYPLTIDFESFGWEWIIAPKRYEANYCSGECGLIFMNGYPHTHLIQQTNVYNPTGPCCSPRRMSPISMLYMDSDFNIIYGILPNMVVDKCDCS